MWLANIINWTESLLCDTCFSMFVCLFQSDLSGFYDPCPNEEKMLQIRYLFREAVHEVTVGDNEPV